MVGSIHKSIGLLRIAIFAMIIAYVFVGKNTAKGNFKNDTTFCFKLL